MTFALTPGIIAALAAALVVSTPAVDPVPGAPTPGAPDGGGENVTPTPGAPTPGTPEPTPEHTPEDTPAPAPSPAPTGPTTWSGPGTVPDPPAVTPGITYVPPSYSTPYAPTLPQIQPRPVTPVAPIIPPPNRIRVGNFITPIPEGMAASDVRSINRWSAYSEAQVATGLISLGVPKDEATRRAAATVLGAAGGAATGAVVAGAPAAVLGGALGVVPGAIAGGAAGGILAAPLGIIAAPVVPPAVVVPLGVLAGAGAGAVGGTALGAAALGIPAALAGGAVGGVIGGGLGYALGAGDPGASPDQPREAPGDQDQGPWTPPPPHPDANQYELTVDHDGTIPTSVDYTVKTNGDVRGNVKVGPADIDFGWSAEQADAPYKQAGFLAQTARDTVTQEVVKVGKHAKRVLPDVGISYPQFD